MQFPRFGRALVAFLLLLLPVSAHAASGPGSVVPPAIGGWHQVGGTKFYDGNTLFDLVDGEAEAVKAYSFAGCAYAEFAPGGATSPELTISVFDMSDSLNAFGLFGNDRLSGKPVSIGTEGVLIEPTGLNFWKGRYVVRTVIFHPTDANRAALHAFANAAAARIGGGGGVPAIVAALPAGRQPRSEKYVRENVSGHAVLTNAIVARYPALGQGAELYIAAYPNTVRAQDALNRYWNSQINRPGLTAIKGLGSDAFRYEDRYEKNVVVAWRGRYVVGVDHAKDAAAAQRLIEQALVKLH